MMIMSSKNRDSVINEMGIKLVAGLVAMNAAVIVCVLSNYKDKMNEFIATALILWEFGMVLAFSVGWSTYELYSNYLRKMSNRNNKKVAKEVFYTYNFKKTWYPFISMLFLCLGMCVFLYGILLDKVILPIGVMVVIALCIASIQLIYIKWKTKEFDFYFWIVLIFVSVTAFLIEAIVCHLLPVIIKSYEEAQYIFIILSK